MNNEVSLFCNSIHQHSNSKFPPTKEFTFHLIDFDLNVATKGVEINLIGV